jgi:hypothetical protein
MLSAGKLRKLWDSLSELRSSLCERRLEMTVLRPTLLFVKTAQFTQFLLQLWRHTVKSSSLTWYLKYDMVPEIRHGTWNTTWYLKYGMVPEIRHGTWNTTWYLKYQDMIVLRLYCVENGERSGYWVKSASRFENYFRKKFYVWQITLSSNWWH